MRTTVEVQAVKLVKEVQVTCDRCKLRNYSQPPRRCVGCNCDVCKQCLVTLYAHAITNENPGNYSEVICYVCYKFSEKYAVQVRQLQNAYADAVEQALADWRAECRATLSESAQLEASKDAQGSNFAS